MNKRWGANIYIIISIALGYILSVLVFSVLDGGATNAVQINWLNILNIAVILLIPTSFFIISDRKQFESFFKKEPFKKVPLYLLAVPVLWSSGNYLNSQISTLLRTFGVYPIQQLPPSGEPASVVTGFILTCIAAPVMEEIFYRGVILHLLKGYGNGSAIIVSALLFAIGHGSITVFAMPLVYGLVFAYITLKSESIFPAIIMHSGCNLLSWLLMTFETGQTMNILVTVLIIVLGAGGIVWAIIKIIKKRDKALATVAGVWEYVKNPICLPVLANYIYTNITYHG